jgi:hypothetical protein
MNDDFDFERLVRVTADPNAFSNDAPTTFKARLYTRLIHAQQEVGELASVRATKAAGHDLCVFEELVQIAPVGQTLQSKFYCDVCHARVLAEHLDNPPIWWPHCPYAEFKR